MKPTNILRKFFAPLAGATGFINSWRTPGYDRDFMHKYNGYVYACVSAIAEDVAMIEFKVYRKLTNGDLADVATHPLLKLLDNPNPLMSKYQLIEMTQTHIELTGEAFWYSEIGEDTKRPKSFYLLPPERMAVAIDRNSSLPRIAGYVFTQENGTRIPLDPEEVTHFKMPNPWDPYRGYGTVEAALLYIQTEKFGAEFTRNYIFNNAMPAGILSVKGAMDSGEFEKVKQQWKQEYGTLNKAGKTAIVKDMDFTFTKVGTTLGEAALKEIKDMSRDDIMTMFRVSKPILGIFEDVNLASAKTAQYVFMSRVIDPKMARMIDTLQFVLNRWNNSFAEYVMGYTSPVPEDIDDKIKVYQAGLNNWLTVNEIRKQEGMEDVDGGGVIRQPINLFPIGEQPEPAAAPGAKAVKPGGIIIRRTIRKNVVKPKNLEYERKESFRRHLMTAQEQWTVKFHDAVKKVLDTQLKEILANLKEMPQPKTKAFDEFKFDAKKSENELLKHLTPLEYELAKQQGEAALAYLGEKELQFQLRRELQEQIEKRLKRWGAAFDSDTRKAIEAQMGEAFANNESLDQIKKRLKDNVYHDAKGYRSERAARTETLNASNGAAQEAYAQTGYITKEEWFADPDACQFCQELNGTVVSISENFVNLGETVTGKDGGSLSVDYTDVGYPPLHPNCTCTVLPVIEETRSASPVGTSPIVHKAYAEADDIDDLLKTLVGSDE